MKTKQILSLEEIFSYIRDMRVNRTKFHKLQDILVIAICAVICGAETWKNIEQFEKEKHEWIESILELSRGIPSLDTFNRVFEQIIQQ